MPRLDAAAWLAAAELYLDLYAESDAHASRALTLARTTGQGHPFGLYQILLRVWYVRAKLAEAADSGRRHRSCTTPRYAAGLAGNLFNRSVIAVAVGDLDVALATAEGRRAHAQPRRRVRHGVGCGEARRGAGRTGQPVRAVELLLGRAGGEELMLIPGGWRAYCLELLTRCWLSLDRSPEAKRAAALAEVTAAAVQLPLAAAWADRAVAAVALHARGRRPRCRTRARLGRGRSASRSAHRGWTVARPGRPSAC